MSSLLHVAPAVTKITQKHMPSTRLSSYTKPHVMTILSITTWRRKAVTIDDITPPHLFSCRSTGWLKKSKLLIIAVNEINASQTRVSFAKFIPKLKRCSTCAPLFRTTVFQSSIFFIKILSSLPILPTI